MNISNAYKEALMKEVESKKIKIQHGNNILRWWRKPKGIFHLREAYNIHAGSVKQVEERKRENL